MNDTEKQAYKDRILTELFNSKRVHNKLYYMVCRHTKPSTKLFEDVISQTFLHLSKHNFEEIIEMYEDTSKDRLLGLSVTIAIRTGLTHNSKNPGYPRHSVLTQILNQSNLNKADWLEVTSPQQFDVPDTEDTSLLFENEVMQTIRDNLTPDELSFLEYWLNKPSKKGKNKNKINNQYNNLLTRIKQILKQHNYKIKEDE